jgi:hypothetical protein
MVLDKEWRVQNVSGEASDSVRVIDSFLLMRKQHGQYFENMRSF